MAVQNSGSGLFSSTRLQWIHVYGGDALYTSIRPTEDNGPGLSQLATRR